MEYNFTEIEKKWHDAWVKAKTYKVENDFSKPKYYVLDMFPYPSGAGLHVGHPLGYIASDIFARYKKLNGFNVLHPMGYDAFGLPAEQYAIEHGIHPKISTDNNIATFRKQMDKIGFCFDWDREVKTCDPKYYKWTQWIFLQMFNSYFNRKNQNAEPIEKLIKIFEQEGNKNNSCPGDETIIFSAADWKNFSEKEQQNILMQYRLAYCGYGEVNWCEALGTVLANDEVVNGVSERGGHKVEKKRLRQWYLRITEYAERLLKGLETIDFSDAMKEMQTNWIGKSIGADITWKIAKSDLMFTTFTTRPDTIFGVDFMVLAPELELIKEITTNEQKEEVEKYLSYVKSRSERERMAEKKITGVFSGAYCEHPFTKKKIPIWISEYVLAGYGTGAIMAVPCGDERDHKFAKHFNIPITNIIGKYYNGEEANPSKDAVLENSDFLNGMLMKDAIEKVVVELEKRKIGSRKTNYKMRDAAFSRQRYWGEPFPIIWKDGIAYPLSENELPLLLPDMKEIKPGKDGEGPLSNNKEWINDVKKYLPNDSSTIPPLGGGGAFESSTMPGYAGSSWYFLRYMDVDNEKEFCNKKVSDYWNQVDLYVGGTEHAVGHLLYSRMWTKVLHDLGFLSYDEPYKKLLNQGMIQGSSRFVFRVKGENKFVSNGLKEKYQVDPIHADVNMVDGYELDIEAFKKWRNGEYAKAEFILEDGKYICGSEVEKMSKSKFNTVNPDDIINKFGADTFRMYEMFLGPVEMSKPWDTKGIEGVHRFLKKLWRLFYDENEGLKITNDKPSKEELKVLHNTIKKVTDDIERFSFNTAVSNFMICVNELSDLKSYKKDVLLPLIVLLQPFAPYITEELYSVINPDNAIPKGKGIIAEKYPKFNEEYIKETDKEYPISVNGKLRTNINISLEATQEEVEKIVLANEVIQKWLDGKPHKKIIYVKNKMVNVVM